MAVVSKRSRSDDPVSIDGLDQTALRGMYRAMLLTRSIEERGHSLYRRAAFRAPSTRVAGTRPQRSARPGRWRRATSAAPPRGPRRARRARHGALAHHRPVPRPQRRADARARRQRAPRRPEPRHAHDGLAPARDAAGGGRVRARLPHSRRAARGARLARRRRVGPRRRPRGDEPGRRAAAPVVFVLDNNGFAYSTPAHLEYGVEHLAERAAAYGFAGRVVDGTDAVAVYKAAHEAIERARRGGGPTLLELVTLRMEGHAVHDDAFYVPRAAGRLARARSDRPPARAPADARRKLRRGRRRGALQRGRARGRRRGRAGAGQPVARSATLTDGVYR